MTFSNSAKAIAAGVVLILLLSSVYLWRARPQTTAMNLGVVTRQDLTQRVSISGKVSPKHRLDIKPPYAGYVRKIYVKVGDRVKAGDPLVTFSPSLSQNETNFPMRAAFTGLVTQVLRTEGESVSEGAAGTEQGIVVRVEDTSELFVEATVPELDIAKIKKGQKASVKISAIPSDVFDGEIQEISLSAKDKDRWASGGTEFQIWVKLNSKDPRLLPGMSALMDVVTARAEKVLSLTHAYIQSDPEGYSFVTTEKGEKRKIEVGLQTDEAVEIKAGLAEGERVRLIDFLSLPPVPN